MRAATRSVLPDRTRHIVMLAYPDAQILDITGPLEVFARASRWIGENIAPSLPAYSVEVAAEAPGPVRTSGGLQIVATRSYRDIEEADTLLVTGGIGFSTPAGDRALLDWLREMSHVVRRIGSICTGSLILAAAGLLRNRAATTHWAYCDELGRAAPSCEVRSDAVYVQDGNVFTSAGVTAGMDLALALVEADWGRPVALRVAQELVMYLVRPGGQSQFSRHLEAQQRAGRFGELELWVIEHLHEPLPVERLAEIAAISPRHFARRFAAEFGMPPASYVAALRVERARGRIESSPGERLKEIARACGFADEQNLRRAFVRALGITPEQYRERFGAAAP